MHNVQLIYVARIYGVLTCSACPFKWTPNGWHQRTCAEGNPADQLFTVSRPSARPHSGAPFSFVKYIYCVHVVSFLACVAGVRNFKNVLLINQKIYVHSWVFVCYQYWGILHCNALPAFSLRDASCNIIDIEIMCRAFGSVIVVLFPSCSFARGKGSLETMSYLTVFDCRHGFKSTF